MPKEQFTKYEYQNLICEHDLSGLEMRILIRFSNSYGKNGLIFPSNAKIAIWLGKVSQEDYDKKNKTDQEKAKIKNAKRVIRNAMEKLETKNFIKRTFKGSSRMVLLVNPETGNTYGGDQMVPPEKEGGIKRSPQEDQTVPPGGSDDPPSIIKIKINDKVNYSYSPPPENLKYQVVRIFKDAPIDIKSDKVKAHDTREAIKIGIANIGFGKTEYVFRDVCAGSHSDFVLALENGFRKVANGQD